ncbi:hypothetical protein GOP47_0026387 [Adiantum capillus-veneris]|nr:hypothetical protein GOP47_0026387 [Adiantum capillus-veneris]
MHCRTLNYVPRPTHVEFYAARATPGGLLITEAVFVSQAGIGFPHSPGIWSDEKVEAWRKVVTTVHKKGGIIFCQLWHVGRALHSYNSMWIWLCPRPRALQIEETSLIISEFHQAAGNARRAGFDGVEIHGGLGYLVDQFFKDGINDWTDEYVGSVESRGWFALEVVDAVSGEMGEEHTAI